MANCKKGKIKTTNTEDSLRKAKERLDAATKMTDAEKEEFKLKEKIQV